jgi:NAD+ synthase (glutamine-hydrolysing)
MKIAMAQLNIQAGQIDANLKNMHQLVLNAIKDNADIIVFPEMAVGGYLISDYYLQESFFKLLTDANDVIKSWSTEIGIIWGNVSHKQSARTNRDGRFSRYNTAFFAYKNKWVEKENKKEDGHYYKHCLPDYRFFDDSRYFKSGYDNALENNLPLNDSINPFIFHKDNKRFRIGLEVCEDLWSKDYLVDPTSIYIEHKVDFIINISSSPWTLNKELSREKRILEHVKKHGNKMVPIVYVNASGMQNNGKNVLVFDGDSTIYNRDGSVLGQCKDDFKQDCFVFDLDKNYPVHSQTNKLLNALVTSIYEFDKQILPFKPKWIIGLSGGIDSSVNAALLCMALGNDRVIAYNMASRYNQSLSKNIAYETANKLGIEYFSGSIEQLVQATENTLKEYGIEAKEGLAYENIQARLRGHLLSSFASYRGGVICNNANKVECALGYATLYGDTIGALSPLGDCTKLQVFELAKSINDYYKQMVIDSNLIPIIQNNTIEFGFAPSAELRSNQVDPMKWVYHDWLVQYFIQYPSHHMVDWLKVYQSGEWRNTEVAQWMNYYGLDNPVKFIDDIRWFMKSWHTAIFKRIQFPPIVTISRGSFGFDYRESQIPYVESKEVNALIEQILNGNHS